MDAGGFLAFGIYLVQQLGVIVAVGAELLLLCAYLLGSTRHESITRSIQAVGLMLVVMSGVGAVAYHSMLGQVSVLMAPAFLSKWALIVFLVVWVVLRTYAPIQQAAFAVLRGFVGAQWFALLIVHTLAPVVEWGYLLGLYGAWVAVFMAGWGLCVYMLLWPKHIKPAVPPPAPPTPVAPVVAAVHLPVPAPSAPTASVVSVYHKEIESPHTTPIISPAPVPSAAPAPVKLSPQAAPAPKPPAEPSAEPLPAIRVMPRTEGEIAGSARGGVVQFN